MKSVNSTTLRELLASSVCRQDSRKAFIFNQNTVPISCTDVVGSGQISVVLLARRKLGKELIQGNNDEPNQLNWKE